MSAKMSLVVLRSWTDGPPKVRAIAPPDDDRSLRIEPDLQGRFLTQEITENDPKFNPREKIPDAKQKHKSENNHDTLEKVHHQNGDAGENKDDDLDGRPQVPLFIRRRNDHLKRNLANRHSYGGSGAMFDSNGIDRSSPESPNDCGEGKLSSVGRHYFPGKVPPDSLTIRPGSACSPDHHDGSSMEYTTPTPPSSPVTGRYRNLGPELAATIPKRTIKSSWITGIKSRWMKSTTHPESGRSTLKSYSSTPSLLTAVTASSGPKEELHLDPSIDISSRIDRTEGSPFFNPLYKLIQHRSVNSHPNHFRSSVATGSNNSTGSTNSSSGIALSADDDSHSERSRSSLSNPVSYSPSPPPPQNPVASLRHQIVCSSSRPNGLQKYNSLTDFSEEDLFGSGGGSGSVSSGRSQAGSPYYGTSSGYGEESQSQSPPPQHQHATDECVLVEVIRKPETPPNKSSGRVKGVKNEKRYSIGELEPEISSKFAGVKVEGSPGKVARIKENIKKFGKFGRTQSEKVLRFQTDSQNNSKVSGDTSATNKEDIETTSTIPKEPDHPNIQHPIPIARKRSKNSESEIVLALSQPKEDQTILDTCKTKINQVKPFSPPAHTTPTKIENNKGQSIQSDVNQKHFIDISHFGCTVKDNKLGVFSIPKEERLSKDGNDGGATPYIDIRTVNDYNEEHILSISDLDRSMSSNFQSVPTIDIETFEVHSASHYKVSDQDQVLHNSDRAVNPIASECDANVSTVKSIGPAIKITDNSNPDEKNSNKENKEVNIIDTISSEAPQADTMFRRNGVSSHEKVINTVSNANSHTKVNGQSIPGVYSGNVKAVVNQLSTASAPDATLLKIGHGKYPKHLNSNGMASVQVPVQAINRHVMGFGMTNIYANSVEEDDRGSNSPASASSGSRSTDSDWHRSSTRASFRGFCEGLLQDEKITIQVPEVREASISFDNEDNNSSLDPDEERENSVDYISIADVKVNRARQSGKSDSLDVHREPLPSCVISLDIGSRGSGYSYWIKEEDDCVRIGHVDLSSSCPKSHKLPSWVSVDDMYLDVEDDDDNTNNQTSPAFGYHALNQFLSEQSQPHLFWKWRENFNEGSTFPYTLESRANDEELQLTMKAAIKHYSRIALDQIALKKRDCTVGQTILVVAIPSNFDQHARQLVRDAAFGSGLISQKDGLAVIEDPCAAGIFAYYAIKSKISKMSNIGTSYLSVDIGGVYLHSSGYEVSEGKLYQILKPKSEPIPECPEFLFEAELSAIFTPSFILNYQNKYKAGWLKLMTEFELCKNMYDPLQRGNYHVFIPSSFVDHFRRFTSMEVEDALESSDILWSRVGTLGIPYWKMQRFLQPMMEFIKNHVVNVVKNHSYDFLVLTGGRSGSRQLVDYLKNAVRDYSVDIAVPKEYSAAVLQGSTIALTNLAPRLIIKSPFSIGVGVMTPFIEDQHPEEKRVLRDGKAWCADVWDSLIHVGQELELNHVILRRSYVGAQPGQSLLILPLFQSPDEPKFVTETSVKKCCEFKFNSSQRAWQEVELVIKCRPSELLIIAVDGGIMKSVVVLDFST